MLLSLSWRNVWRNRLRSGIVLSAIALGLFGGIFTIAFMNGMAQQRVRSAIENEVSHIQLHNPSFLENFEIRYFIGNADSIRQAIGAMAHVKAASERIVVNGMALSATSGSGVSLNGIDPSQEQRVTAIHSAIVKGTYFDSKAHNPAVISTELAEKLGLKLRSKLVTSFQRADGTMTGAAFKIVGLYKTSNSTFDEMNAFVLKDDLARLAGIPAHAAHEIAVLADDRGEVDQLVDSLHAAFPALSVRSWQKLQPELAVLDSYMSQMMFLFMVIIMAALAFGIVNTMMMSVLERSRELGMLRAIGMKKPRVFLMILLETIFLSITGGILGMIIGGGVVAITHRVGINLSVVGQGLSEIGYAAVIYPEIGAGFFFMTTALVVVTAIFSSLWPAMRALSLVPVEVIRADG